MGAAGQTASATLGQSAPENAIALVGVSIAPTSIIRHIFARVHYQSASSPSTFHVGVMNVGGDATRSLMGSLPISKDFQIQVQSILVQPDGTAETGSYSVFAHWLVKDPLDPDQILVPAIPFKASGEDPIVEVSSTSAANTAQTVDFRGETSDSQTEIIGAFFYTSASTATGEIDYFDGTTAVTIDSTAAVAEYTFNLGAKSPKELVASQGGSVNLRVRFVIGAAGVGNTSTLVVQYRARAIA